MIFYIWSDSEWTFIHGKKYARIENTAEVSEVPSTYFKTEVHHSLAISFGHTEVYSQPLTTDPRRFEK
ncbi:MAG: hypothetical protein EZS28_035130 [Streblomastix strix]|uniref:Uncharacterized protein n=1 Tax=Streblomastix strix TaxID=222440 RepID=A0A5J4UGI7_9EUKA|nr:MAG: hypothetical protein EZS28_035130 [Streblomastix strix]